MTHSNYSTPQSPLGVPTQKQGSPVKAVLYGLLVDFGGTILASMVISVVYGIMLVRTSMSEQEIERALTDVDPFSVYGLILSGAGLFCSFWGGYVCALNSRTRIVRDAAILSALTVTLGILMSGAIYTVLQHALMAIAGIVAIYGGAWLWKRTHG